MLHTIFLIAALCGADAPPARADDPRTAAGRIDAMVFAKLAALGIPKADHCSDEVFVRRAYLDTIGTLPTPEETRRFLADRSANRRHVLVERLLARDELPDYWAMKWSDLLRVKAEFPINLWPNAAQAYHRWIRTAVKDNMPLDLFARELLTANGSNFRVGQVNFYRALQNRRPEGIAQAVALLFLGQRVEHWPKARLDGLVAFFTQVRYKPTGEWKEEIVLFDPEYTPDASEMSGAAKPGTAKPPKSYGPAVFPDGRRATVAPGQDPRAVLADWLAAPENPDFARCVVNRVWYWFLGRGIVHEPDDFRPDNPPSHPELLDYLARQFVASRYDMRYLFRAILHSKVYQLSSIPKTDRPEAEKHFASYRIRRLEAEVLMDALNQATGATEKYTSPIPEPFTFIPEKTRSIALADGSVTSAFLEMFGRPPRDTGLESERNNRTTAAQRLHMLNSSHILRKIEQSPKLADLARTAATPQEVVDGMYLLILSRYPTAQERQRIAEYRRTAEVTPRETLVDLAWALVNTAEFLYRH